MEFRILGPLEVADGDDVLPLGGGKQHALLAVLLLSANEVVSSDRLIDELWGGRSPDSGRTALQVRVSRLRKALGSAGAQLRTRAPGYVFELDREQLDLHRFERLIEEASVSEPAVAAEKLRRALALWRGPPLADLGYESFAQAAIGRIQELRITAIEQRIDADLALGRHARLVAELELLVAEHPLRERLAGQLMLALYRCGRQADALETYRGTHRRLRDELSLEAGRALQRLERAILEQDSTLDLMPAPSAAPPVHLPRPATAFVGRARELADVTTLLAEPGTRLLTLTGTGGSGKTRLALRAAEQSASGYRDGIRFIGFATVVDPASIALTITQALGLAEQPGVTPAHRLQEWLRERSVLLLLDNLEQLAAGTVLLGELLASCPGLTIMVTSRVPLHLAGEQQYEVPVLARADAIALFTARTHATTPLRGIDPDLAGQICERLDCLPLAIELAAPRTKTLLLSEILARLENRLPVLGAGPRDAPRRQYTLRATIDWSYDLLSRDEQRLFARLGVFADGFTLGAAETVCQADLDTLQALTDRSLITTDHGRYRMLEALREYALEKLDHRGEVHEVRRRHLGWAVELLQAGEPVWYQPEASSQAPLLAAERENFRAALEWAADTDQNENVARLAVSLARWLWSPQGLLSEAERWLGLARDHLTEYPKALQAHVLRTSRFIAWGRGAHDEGAEFCDQALAMYLELGDRDGICWEILARGCIASERGDLAQGRADFEAALLYGREHDLPLVVPNALGNLGSLAIAEGRLDEARTLCEKSLALTEQLDPRETDVQLLNLAQIANLQCRHGDAATLARLALTAAFNHQAWATAAEAVIHLAWPLADEGQLERAARLLGAALGFYERADIKLQRVTKFCLNGTRQILSDQLDIDHLQALLDEGRKVPLEFAARDALNASPDIFQSSTTSELGTGEHGNQASDASRK